MPIPRIDDVRDRRRRFGRGSRAWAEWWFIRVCLRHFRLRFVFMVALLLVGAVLFRTYEPEQQHSFPRAAFYTFSLIFGETPEDFPKSPVLQVLFFAVPILGLTVIVEGIIDFSLILRDRRRFERNWCRMLASTFKDHVVVVGLGRLGFRTFMLLRRMGVPVVVIERDPNNQFLEEVRRDGTPVLIGDARRESMLEEANVRDARSIVLATDDDMANLECGLDARKISNEIRVVMRMFDQNVADKIRDGFQIHLAMSQSAISAPTFATSALSPATVNSFIVGDDMVTMQRWLVRKGDPFCDQTVAQVMGAHRVVIVEHQAKGDQKDICPPPDTRLNAGDGLMIQGRLEVLAELRASSMPEGVT